MARAVPSRVEEKPRVDPDATAQLERPPAEANAPTSRPVAARRPVDRWSTVFTVFAAVALVALLLLGAAVISSQQVAAPSTSPSTSPSSSPSSSASPSISLAPVVPSATAMPTETPTLTPVPTRTPPLTPLPTVLPSVPVTPLPTRT